MHPFAASPSPTQVFPDLRLDKRFLTLVDALAKNPTGSIPEACENPAATKAAYRFLNSENFSTETIDEWMYQETLGHIPSDATILVAQDTTSLNYSSHPQTKDLGYIDDKHTKGLLMHTGFAITQEGLPLGVLYRKTWVRSEDGYGKREQRKKKPTEAKESFRWQETASSVEARIPSTVRVITISDRESDVFDYLARERASNCEFLLRITQNRCLAKDSECHLLFEQLEAAPIQERAVISITDHQTGLTRHAHIHYRWSDVLLNPPVSGNSTRKHPVHVSVILVREEEAPNGVKPVEWKLMTSVTISTIEDALRAVQWYGRRWLIERFHYVLKSGCTIEKLQLETAAGLDRAIAMYAIVAWRLMYLTYLGRVEPEASAEKILQRYEWEALYCFTKKTRRLPDRPPTVSEAIKMIAGLGGFMGRKGDGAPGVKVLWRGMRRLDDIAEAYRFFLSATKEDVGNG